MDDPILPPSAQPKRFFDVMPPKHTMPNSTSRPLIVGNKSEQEDPMVKHPDDDLPMVIEDGPHDTVEADDKPKEVEATAEDTAEESVPVSTTPNEEVSEEAVKEEGKSEPEPTDTPDSPPAETVATEEPPTEPLATETTSETPAASPPVASEASVAKTLELTDKEDLPNPDEPLLPAQAAPAANEMVVAHHNHKKHNSWLIFILVFIIVILLAVIGDLLLDGGTIKVSNLPHTHFFNK